MAFNRSISILMESKGVMSGDLLRVGRGSGLRQGRTILVITWSVMVIILDPAHFSFSSCMTSTSLMEGGGRYHGTTERKERYVYVELSTTMERTERKNIY